MGTKIIDQSIKQVFESESQFSEWFGYYNYSPFSPDNQCLLCHRADIDSIPEQEGLRVELGYYSLCDKQWHHIDYSDSWNWQQGSMLQWIPCQKNNTVVFNCSKNQRLISKICDIDTGEERELCFPIYGITPDGKHSITIDMERSYWCRAYHYQSVKNRDKEGRVYSGDGIFDLDLQKNICKRIISIEDVIKADYDPCFDNKKHWLEHVMISPSGKRFSFLHRFSSIDNVNAYDTRLCIADIDGGNLQILKEWKSYDWSHFGWCNDNSFSIYSYRKGITRKIPSLSTILKNKPYNIPFLLIRLVLTIIVRLPENIRKRVLNESSYYQFYTINKNGVFFLTDSFNNREFEIDGHPSFTKDGIIMMTDTYPDHNLEQYLYFYNRNSKEVKRLLSLSANVTKGNESCDLHPKFSFDQRMISVDSDYMGRRRVLCFSLNDNLM